MNFKTKLAGASAVVLSLLGSGSYAALVDNGISMIDTATGLEWLDLTQTQGISWNAAEASAFVTTGGYVHATVDQVTTLFYERRLLDD